MDNIAVSVKNISKSFKLYYDQSVNLKERALFWKRNRYESHQVLKDISFDVKRGEAVALVGINGCGKSTTLKMLSRIMSPDSGTIEMSGRVSALIELGAGFHPDMSGRENIYINAAIFGLSRKEIDERIQSIIDFSELGAFIDNPVRTYSSGMYMRLAFSVAINVDADILLVDEILAVGDAAFQAKCFHRMEEIKAQGVTIIIVSHSLGQIEQICDRSLWIDQGRIRMEGRPIEVHPYYLDYIGNKNAKLDQAIDSHQEAHSDVPAENREDSEEPLIQEDQQSPPKKRWGNRDVEIETVRILDSEKRKTETIRTGDAVQIEICYRRNNAAVKNAAVGFGIFRIDGENCYGTNTYLDYIRDYSIEEQGKIVVDIPALNLLPGIYLLDIAFHKEDGFSYDYWRECVRFTMYSNIQDVGITRIEHRWIFG